MNWKVVFAIWSIVMPYFVSPYVLAEERCSPPEGLASATSKENLRFLVFGEVHGTAEAPALFAESVCAAVTSDMKVLVGLEFSEASAGVFRQFLDSAGGPEDVKNLLTDSYWSQQAAQFPDGRTSQAMLDLVQRLRGLHSSGYELSIAPFVRPALGPRKTQTPYEKGLAESLMEAESDGSYDLVMVLVGNLHASKDVINAATPFEPMAMHLPQDETVTLRMGSEGGTAWNCTPECGIHPLGASFMENITGIVIGKGMVGGYDGIFNIGTASASPPVTEMP